VKANKKQDPVFSAITKLNLQQSGSERLDAVPVPEPAVEPEVWKDQSSQVRSSPPELTAPSPEGLTASPESLSEKRPVIAGSDITEAAREIKTVGEPPVDVGSVTEPVAPLIKFCEKTSLNTIEARNDRLQLMEPHPFTDDPGAEKPPSGEEGAAPTVDSAPYPGSEVVASPAQELILPLLKLASTAHNFGRLLIGESKTWKLCILNEGGGGLVVSGLEGLPANGFKLATPPLLPLEIRPQEALNLDIEFAPNLSGGKSAKLLVHCEPGNFLFSEVALQGTGVEVIATDVGTVYSPISNSLDMAFVYIWPGSFLMGSPDTETGRRGDEIQHEVHITKPFYIQTTPVNQRQWQAVWGSNPSKFAAEGDNRPVEGVSWSDCQEFIKRLNSSGEGVYRLPTEAEWEFACRAGTVTAFASGEITQLYCDYDPNLAAMGWYCYNAGRQTHSVGLKDPNPWGLYDMHGNVGEWCQDWYGDYFPGTAVDQAGPSAGTGKIVRGGSWFASAKNCRSASRFKWFPHSRGNLQVIGFRLVKEV
jgi:formylglycine-generating enzyme required for sulfatase activity